MDILSLLQYTLTQVIGTFAHKWWLLLISILISAALKLYVNQEAVAGFLRRNTKNSVLISTGVAVTTPFCSCGTTAVVLGMMASTIPWAPIIAFMVASPLTSPQELFYSAGLFGWNFAIAFFSASNSELWLDGDPSRRKDRSVSEVVAGSFIRRRCGRTSFVLREVECSSFRG